MSRGGKYAEEDEQGAAAEKTGAVLRVERVLNDGT